MSARKVQAARPAAHILLRNNHLLSMAWVVLCCASEGTDYDRQYSLSIQI